VDYESQLTIDDGDDGRKPDWRLGKIYPYEPIVFGRSQRYMSLIYFCTRVFVSVVHGDCGDYSSTTACVLSETSCERDMSQKYKVL